MKILSRFRFFGFAPALACFLFAGSVLAQASETPEQAARDYYRWYIQSLNAEKYPIQRQKSALLKKVSARLGKWIYSPAYREYGADYFLDAQDWDENWIDGISTSKATVSGNAASLRVTLVDPKKRAPGYGRRVLTVKMVKEGGAWKLDRVTGQNN
jgi:hypothetical protein